MWTDILSTGEPEGSYSSSSIVTGNIIYAKRRRKPADVVSIKFSLHVNITYPELRYQTKPKIKTATKRDSIKFGPRGLRSDQHHFMLIACA